MKKIITLILGLTFLVGCSKHDIVTPQQVVSQGLSINSTIGVKLATTFVTSEVSMNIKTSSAQTVTIKILDITNRIVSKSTANVAAGDNILTLYTSAFPSSAYRIAVYDSLGNLLAITDFNKM